MKFDNKKFLEYYLQKQYGVGEFEDVSDRNWTYDIEITLPNKTNISAEVKERNITQDWVKEAEDIAIELIQDYRFFSKTKFGQAPFEYAKIDFSKFLKSLGWIFTETAQRLIYIKYIDTETKRGVQVLDLDFPAFKTWFIMEVVPVINTYKIQKNTTQTKSKSQSFNILIPIEDIPGIIYDKFEGIVEK